MAEDTQGVQDEGSAHLELVFGHLTLVVGCALPHVRGQIPHLLGPLERASLQLILGRIHFRVALHRDMHSGRLFGRQRVVNGAGFDRFLRWVRGVGHACVVCMWAGARAGVHETAQRLVLSSAWSLDMLAAVTFDAPA